MMPLVPGLALTNAIRDTLQGDYISAGSRMIEALMIAASVALGVGAGLSLSGAAGLSSALNFTFDLSVHDALAFLKAVIFSSLAILGFALYFEIPKRYLLPVCVIAFVSWAVFLVSDSLGLSTAWASFFAALVSDFLAYFCARALKAPVILFLRGDLSRGLQYDIRYGERFAGTGGNAAHHRRHCSCDFCDGYAYRY